MSQTIEQLEENYLKQKQQYEDKMDDLRVAKHKGEQILEELAEASRYYIKTITDDQSALQEGLRALNGLGDEFQDTCQNEIKKLDSELEEVASDYQRNYQKLTEQIDKNEEEASQW
ncbi:hypothetical protein ACYSNR_05970 [Enterococcus sp. LJL128]|uniref:hypothetical protein n=1 Tax=Enterococcus sp. LJL51 TaxID=3416656 RepID=UPI003CE7EB80